MRLLERTQVQDITVRVEAKISIEEQIYDMQPKKAVSYLEYVC